MGNRYKPLSSTPEKDYDLLYRDSFTFDDAEKDSISSETRRASRIQELGKSRWLWSFHACIFITNVILLILTFVMPITTIQHVRQFSVWSSAAPAVQYEKVVYNTSTKGNRFTGAGPDVDKAWREISYDVGDHWIPKLAITKLGSPPTSLKAVNPKTGEEGYRVGIEVFHQLHCINLLRRVTYRDYYEPLGGEFAAGPGALQAHTDHCIEILRLNTQCNADIGLFTFHMVPGDPLAWPDLDSTHICRNFDGIRQWAMDNSIGNMEVLA